MNHFPGEKRRGGGEEQVCIGFIPIKDITPDPLGISVCSPPTL